MFVYFKMKLSFIFMLSLMFLYDFLCITFRIVLQVRLISWKESLAGLTKLMKNKASSRREEDNGEDI